MECLNYPIYFTEGFDGLMEAFNAAGLNDRRICLVTDENVSKLYLSKIQDKLSAEAFVFTPGEENKNLNVIRQIYDFFLKTGMDRRSVAVALGGGVTGDMTGFAAATFMRGIPFVQIPTTMLSQVDSSVGGKTGVDFHGHKNLIGAFYQPAFVYININVLDTLPQEQFASGMGEVIKTALIGDPRFYEMLHSDKLKIKNMEKAALLETVRWSCQIKAAVVTEDEKEKGLREILNFGHTFGHAIEGLSNFSLPHGHCVALGMMAALYLSLKRGDIDEETLNSVRELLEYYSLPVKIRGMRAEDILAQMAYDKKNKGGEIRLVLLEAIGKAKANQTSDNASLLEAIRYITE